MSTTDNNYMITREPMLASFSEIFEMDYALTQLEILKVDYKIDCKTNILTINYHGFEDGTIKMYETVINNFMKKYPNYSKLWSN